MLRIYFADVSALPDQPGLLPISSYRLSQLSSCRSSQKRRQGIGAELLLIHALRSLYGSFPLPLSLHREPGGKPVLTDQPLNFSLSHSGLYAACAISDAPVGIDLEGERPMLEPVLHRCFSPEEQALIRGSARPEAAYIALWTKKESYLKATGEGIRSLHTLNLLRPPNDAFFYHTQLERLHLSVCVLGQIAQPDILESLVLSEKQFE